MNTAFSRKLPTLQTAIDSTSLGLAKECLFKYYLSMCAAHTPESGMTGYAPRSESIHLTFGILLHSAVERYHHLMSPPRSERDNHDLDHGTYLGECPECHDWAVLQITKWALRATWNRETGEPWQSYSPAKNRFTLVRTIIWYLDHYRNDPIKTLRLTNGKPAVELSFQFQSGYSSYTTNEPFVLCGHFDRLGTIEGTKAKALLDLKSTGSTITSEWFDRFSPDNQVSFYDVACQTAFHIPIDYFVIDACQVTITGFVERGSPFNRGLIPRSDFQRQEWYEELGYYLQRLEDAAVTNKWPKNDKACNLYGGCPFRPVCYAPSPEARTQILYHQYTPRMWNPLEKRGDI